MSCSYCRGRGRNYRPRPTKTQNQVLLPRGERAGTRGKPHHEDQALEAFLSLKQAPCNEELPNFTYEPSTATLTAI